MNHRRAGPPDQAAADHPVLQAPRVLRLGPRPVRVAVPVTDVHVRGPAVPARRVLVQVQVGQVQAAQLADPEAPVAQPGHHEPVPCRHDSLAEQVPGAVRQHLRVPAPDPARCQRIGGQLAAQVPQQRPVPVRPGRQPGPVQLPAQLPVDPQRGQVQVKPLQAGGRRRQRVLAIGPLADPPRLAQRHRHLRADDPHIPLQVPQRHRLRRQALPLQPAQVIDQQVRIRPLRPRTVMRPGGTGRPARAPVPPATRS